ncbi:hypothetical protein [Blastococcus litoris]|uniref:hypothetical protein n=1 Tax=Blastococcus litoris TaxID=2171622 RepID=UPI000E30982D|nr:hypothetical protein [Blastococcus litoris]
MSPLLVVVPALLVVVLGYVLGHGLWSAIAGEAGAEPAGWITGLVLLVLVTRLTWLWWRRRRRG